MELFRIDKLISDEQHDFVHVGVNFLQKEDWPLEEVKMMYWKEENIEETCTESW